MAWTAIVVDKSSVDGSRRVNLRFEDGAGAFYENGYEIPLGAPATWFDDTVKKVIADLEARDVVYKALPIKGAPVTGASLL